MRKKIKQFVSLLYENRIIIDPSLKNEYRNIKIAGKKTELMKKMGVEKGLDRYRKLYPNEVKEIINYVIENKLMATMTTNKGDIVCFATDKGMDYHKNKLWDKIKQVVKEIDELVGIK